jgi:hypothetical protein
VASKDEWARIFAYGAVSMPEIQNSKTPIRFYNLGKRWLSNKNRGNDLIRKSVATDSITSN